MIHVGLYEVKRTLLALLVVTTTFTLLLITTTFWSVDESFKEENPPRRYYRVKTWPPADSISNSSQSELSTFIANPEPMVLSLHYWEQMGNALGSLLSLQCWSKSVNISSVVEPLVRSGTPDVLGFQREGRETVQKFENLFDLDKWNTRSSKSNLSRLVSMENFLVNATKNLVYVQILWDTGCKSIRILQRKKWFKYLISHGFHIRSLCMRNIPISSDAFRKKLFILAPDGNITIVFEVWRGISPTKDYRLQLQGSVCQISPHIAIRKTPSPRIIHPLFFTSSLLPAKRVLKFLDTFMSKYNMSGVRYIGVMLRFEKLYQSLHSVAPRNTSCVSALLSHHEEASDRICTTKTILITDYGTHGSLTINRVARGHVAEFLRYFEGQFDLVLSPEEINNALENITDSKDSVLIALLQSQLVARASCVVMAGMGTFQVQTLDAYLYRHKGEECYFLRNGDCARFYAGYYFGSH